MEYPLYSEYSSLFSKYLQGNRTEQLVNLAGVLRNKVVVDLCCGGGRLTTEVLKQNPEFCYSVDQSSKMMTGIVTESSAVCKILSSVEEFLPGITKSTVDVFFCQQAVTYWITPKAIKQLARALKPGGLFIFNTFNKSPSITPLIKEYSLNGENYLEISRLIKRKSQFDLIEHIQIKEGMPCHVTCFSWVSEDEFKKMLEPYFNCEVFVDGATSCWRCTLLG